MLVVAALMAASAAGAQPRPTLSVTLPRADSLGAVGPLVQARAVLADRAIRELMDHGFPARLRYRVELWTTAGWFDRQVRSVEWDVVVRFDPLNRQFEAMSLNGDADRPLGTFRQFADVVAEVERPHRAPIAAPRSRSNQYYNVILTLEMLSVGDLDELQRWVRGDLQPAVRGDRNPGTALGRGVRVLMSRLLGGERRTLEARSARFRVR